MVAVLGLGLAKRKKNSPAGSAHLVATSNPDTASSGTSATAPKLQRVRRANRICAGDSFDVSFELSPEFNQTVTVQPTVLSR